ncbi:MAG TPA: peptidyl-prolyl cis-trans isomerase [Parvularculaceae bacterium]|nr:peptidyl-prolyl cis-trans isomerase [Parvularculaceae bacterium]
MLLDSFAGKAALAAAIVLSAVVPAAALQGPTAQPNAAVSPSSAIPAGAVAVVNDEIVTVDAYKAFIRAYIAKTYYHAVAPERLPSIAEEALDLMVTDRLLLQEARRRELTGDPAAAQKRLEAMRERYSKDPAAATTFEKASADIQRELIADTMIEQLTESIRNVGPFPQEAVKKYYDEHHDLFTTPASTDISIILIGVPPHGVADEWREAMETAAAIRTQILAGGSFEALAKEKSSDQSAADGGRIGPVHKGQLPEQVETGLGAVAIGAVSEPFRILEGAAIFKVNARAPARLQPFSAVEERAGALLKRESQDARWKAFVAQLRQSARIRTAASPVDYVRDH